jgi:thiol-disulfide isomerase/thioredoxin
VRLVALITLVALVATAGCTRGRDAPRPPVTQSSGTAAPCLPAATPVASLGDKPTVSAASPAVPAGGEKLPDLAIACFAGGGEVRIAALSRPAIVNLWASWCTPCRKELPALNTYAERGSVLVLGVATDDSRTAAGSIIDDLGLRFPNLYDREGKLHKAIGSVPLPVTLFLAADGTVAYTHRAGALDTAGFERLAREHLGAP